MIKQFETIEFWAEEKRLTMRDSNNENDHYIKSALLEYVNFCDSEISRILGKKRRRRILGLFCLLLLMLGGCAKIMRGSGLIAEGIGDGVVAAGQHLQESSNTEK